MDDPDLGEYGAVVLAPELAFGHIEIQVGDDALIVPAALVDREDVLRALLDVCQRGGRSQLERTSRARRSGVIDR